VRSSILLLALLLFFAPGVRADTTACPIVGLLEHAEFELKIAAGEIRPNNLIRYVGADGAQESIKFVRADIGVEGKTLVYYVDAAGQENRIALSDLLAKAKPGSIEVGASSDLSTRAARVGGSIPPGVGDAADATVAGPRGRVQAGNVAGDGAAVAVADADSTAAASARGRARKAEGAAGDGGQAGQGGQGGQGGPALGSTRAEGAAGKAVRKQVSQESRVAAWTAPEVSIHDADSGRYLRLKFPTIPVEEVPEGVDPRKYMEEVLGHNLGDEYPPGGQRRAFRESENGRKSVVKMYDRHLAGLQTADLRTISALESQEVAMDEFLTEAGIDHAKLDRSAAGQRLWNKGMSRWEEIDGPGIKKLYPDFPRDYVPGKYPKIDEFIAKIRRYDPQIKQAMKERGLGRAVSSKDAVTGERVWTEVGIDYLGRDNIKFRTNGSDNPADWTPTLVDF
jgi:hypothetical protein